MVKPNPSNIEELVSDQDGYESKTDCHTRGHASSFHSHDLLQQLPCPALILDLTGHVIEHNNQVMELLGYSTDELTGLDLETIYPEKQIPYCFPKLVKTLRQHQSEKINARVISNDGCMLDISHEFSLYRDNDGNEKGIICILNKINSHNKDSKDHGLYEDIFNVSNEFLDIIYLDKDLIYREVNQRHLNLLQKNYAEVIGKHVSEIQGKNSYETSIKPNLEKALAGETVYVNRWGEYAGKKKYRNVVVVPRYDNQKEVIGIIILGFDISELKLNEAKLRESERFLKSGQSLVQLGGWEIDIESRVIKLTDEMYAIYKLSPATFDGSLDTLNNHIHPDDLPSVALNKVNELEEGEAYDFNYRIIDTEGDLHYLKGRAKVVLDLDGHPEKIVGASLDVTKQKLEEIARLESETQLKEAQRIAKMGSWNIDLQSKKMHMSDTALSIYGITQDEFKGEINEHLKFVHPDDSSVIERANSALFGSDNKLSFEHRIVRPDGETRYVLVFAEVDRNNNGEAVGVIGTVMDITERKLIELELQRSEHKLLEAQRLAKMGFWELDPSTGLHYWSDSVYILHGLIPDGTIFDQASILSMVHPEDKEHVKNTMDTVIASRDETIFMENRIVKEGGEISYLQTRGEISRDEKGAPITIFGTIIDITEQKLNELELQTKHAQLLEIQSIAHLGFMDVELDTGNIVWSDETYNIFGITPSEFSHQVDDYRKMIHPDDIDGARLSFEHTIKTQDPSEVEYRVIKPDNSIRHVVARGEAKKDKDGKVTNIIGSILDITNIKSTELALRRSEELLRRYFDAGLIGMAIATLDERWIQVNQSLCNILGYTENELLSMTWLEVTHPDDRKLSLQKVQQVLDGVTDNYVMEKRYVRKDGEIIDVSIAAVLRQDEDGKPESFVAFIQDITERKRIEEELEVYRGDLEERVLERTRELKKTQQALVEKEKMVVLGQLTATVSHELRNPLGTIRTSLFAISKRIQKHGIKEFDRPLERAERNIIRCDNIIEELLDYTRTHELHLEPDNINNLINEVLEDEEIIKGVTINLDLGDDIIIFYEKNRLYRCIYNIVSNACQAMQVNDNGNKEKVLTIITRVNNNKCEIIISDTGPGISDENKEKIFEPLFSTKIYGVGLGLSIVNQIMEQHNGGVEMSSIINEGTTFTLWLPVDENE